MASRSPRLVIAKNPALEAASQVHKWVQHRELTAPRLAISGGSSLPAVGELRTLLGQEHWSRLYLTWVDERCVPLSSPESNRGSAYITGALDESWPITVELPLYLDDEDPLAACTRVKDSFLTNFDGSLDVLLIGMGEDGHVASLFPHHPLLRSSNTVDFIDDSPKPPRNRITFGLSALQTAQHVVVLAAGQSKHRAVQRLLAHDPDIVAAALPNVTVVVDDLALMASH